MPEIIICAGCDEMKERASDGASVGFSGPVCKKCLNKAYYVTNKERLNAYKKEWWKKKEQKRKEALNN